MSYNSFPSNQLYGGHKYSNGYNGVSSVSESGATGGGNKYRKRKYHESGPEDNIFFELGKNKRVTVRQFRNINLVDIREYYQDAGTGEMKPGKKGISLTEEQYDELLHNRFQIDDALRQFGSKRKKFKMVPMDASDEEGAAIKKIDLNKRKRVENKEKLDAKEGARKAVGEAEERAKENGIKKHAVERAEIPATNPLNPRLDDLANPRLDNAVMNPRLDDLAKKEKPREKQHISPHEDDDLNSSDEDFAQALESEVRRQDEDISEEE
ncbi:chromatin-binding transcription coactivator SUB1 Ecym_2297 [Eremothecium cymbalariae DBVPG|uniref:Transcriptional coactivator p15 (PC4) C-terminal domain-containing protein n=1 Tax=Eremothecium cymbalariae (strain CBS 270.75 / DBVPG 7215 / KCTC 17166 / NRRL Y-17582) TaxID=931890 RepID=G8JQ37_ERECY|nr:Hypothetical protein Ecym_2297 [Eremothecium cymbalariae DBVPG\